MQPSYDLNFVRTDLTYLFAIALVVQIAYWWALHLGMRRAYRPPASGGPLPPISVVVAVRNEADHLQGLLTSLARQSHPSVEVIVVDDGSTDRSAEIVEKHAHALETLTLIRREPSGKKRTLAAGIDAASHDLLAFTDADCEPPAGWLEALARLHASTENDTILVGYSPFRKRSGTVVERLARYETFVTGFLTAGAIGVGLPYMAVGRNLSYPKSVFRRLDGFGAIMHSLSGDDDLFVQEAVRRGAAHVEAVIDPATYVPTEAPASWREWLRQKRRHASAGRYYRPFVQAHLALFHSSGLVVWLAPIFLGWAGGGILALRLLIQYAALRGAAQRLDERDLLRVQPLVEPLYVLYNTIVAPASLLFMPRRW